MRELCREVDVEGRSFVVRCVHGVDDSWSRYEEELRESGVRLAMGHRAAWLRMQPQPPWLVSAHDESGRCASAIAFAASATRAMPGHWVLRAERVGPVRDMGALAAAVAGAAELARLHREILRLELVTFAFDKDTRRGLSQVMTEQGYSPAPRARFYPRTARVDLSLGENELMASFHPTARRHVRAVGRHPVELRPIRDVAMAPRLAALAHDARRRTGGWLIERPFRELLELARERPELVHFVGMYHGDELVSFASAQAHADYASYADAGSVRRADLKVPLGYAPVWELMRWAKHHELRWFDFGGITRHENGNGSSALSGISDFKRYFRGEELDVADEWVFEPHRLRAALANGLGAAAVWWRGGVL